MNRLLANRLFLQLLFTMMAAVSVAILSAVLISQAINTAETVVVGEANRNISAAIGEMKQQYQYRTGFDSSWQTLPAGARDVSLRGITQIVLRSYSGVEGGFYSDGNLLGYAYPTHDTGAVKIDVPSAEKGLIMSLVKRSLAENRALSEVVRGRNDLLVLGAAPDQNRANVTWAMKRLAGQAAPGLHPREIGIAVLAIASLISIAGTLATGLSLSRGIKQIHAGLASLEKDFDFRLTGRSDELGGIIRAINRMASVRGKLEAELRREDRLRAIGRLSAGLAHEIRNPLNSIALTVQLLERRVESSSISRDDLQVIRLEVNRLNALLTDLLNLHSSRPAQPEMQRIHPIAQHCISLVEKQAEMQNSRVVLESANAELSAFCDDRHLTQTLVNLLLNAVEASPEGGIIRLVVHQPNEKVRLDVEDQGPSLNDDQREHLFEPFYTTKENGSGLGLAVSRELMRSQGADVIYEAYEDGSRFTVELPRSEHAESKRISG